ncbi:MAG: cyclic nucleotide-binding domain-containing protein, partial [Spirochaetaceae bacterium]|nr:cyclic nucleotide-binding domain-containing protein [Spirochaetaceae bacterium]
MEKTRIGAGVYYMDIPEADLRILCGCPADSVKHLRKCGLIVTKEKDGVAYESGPNAILLSDIAIQNGNISNLAEFPILHMLYKQGMIIPGHPNNTGHKPRLMGTKAQINAQSRYIYRGNYGLVSVEEIMAAGMGRDEAEELMRMKLKFDFGVIQPTEELLDILVVGNEPVDIGGGVMLSRTGLNTYVFRYGVDSCEVDLNLGRNEVYERSYSLGYYRAAPEYFSVIHIGEGGGWDPDRPCMSSILTFQGHIYLIDAGPGVLDSLTALGIGVNEIDGIFHTHCHDDHFAGLTSLMRADHRINHYATPLVRAAIIRKFSALMALGEERFSDYFTICDLRFDEWNRIGRLEVMPILSAHPVETSFFYFRTPWAGGYKTYGHLADIASLDVLEGMISESGVSKGWVDKFRKALFMPVDLKKIDAGKGLIHGSTVDFNVDESRKIIMSHSGEKFSLKEKEIGSTTAFGQTDVLVPSRQDFSLKIASELLCSYFPDVEMDLIRLFLDCPVSEFSPGSIVLRKGVPSQNIYLILSGVAEAVDADLGISHELSQGFFIGDISFLGGATASFTYRAVSPVSVLEVPTILFVAFTQEFRVFDELKQLYANRLFLLRTSL